MSHAVHIPKLGLTMEDATVVEWHFADGDAVKKGQTLLTIETDKIMFDIEAEADGFLQRLVQPNARVLVGDLAGHLNPTRDAVAPMAATPAPAPAAAATPGPVAAAAATSGHPAALTAPGGGRLMASPVARSLAAQRRIDLHSVPGSGPGGVILRRDVESAAPPAPALVPEASVASAAAPQRKPMTAMRRAISQRMMQSLQGTAQMTGFGKIDMGEAMAWREALVASEQQLGVRITYTDLVLKAAACVLKELPEINAYIDGDDIVSLSDINLGFAVAVDGGLMVPVIHHVDRLTLVEVARHRIALIAKARAGTLARDEVTGGSFTVSNFGSYGGDFETPILNAPQSALLGIGRIADEPAVRDKQVVVRPMMWISLTFDHRLIDGALAGRFRSRLREFLEQPAQMLAHLR